MSTKSEAGSSTSTIDHFNLKKNPKFIKIKDLTPKSSGFSLYGKMIFSRTILDRLNVDGTRKRVVECFIGDSTGCVMATLENEYIAEIKIGDVLIVRNGHVHMLPQGFLRIGVDKWGRIDTVSGDCMPGTIHYQCNKSDVEYVLTSPVEQSTEKSSLDNEHKLVQKEQNVRKLHPYEEMLTSSNLTAGVAIVGNISKDDVVNAYRLVRFEHPFFKMGIRNSKEGGKEFVEVMKDKNASVPLKYGIISDEKELETNEFWKRTMNGMANEKYDTNSDMCHLELYSNTEMTQHYLIGVVNHAHMDLGSLFSLFHSLLFYLGEILDFRHKMGGKMENPLGFISVRCRRPLVDIISRGLTKYRSNSEKYNIPELNSEFMPPIKSNEISSQEQSSAAKMNFLMFKLNKELTKVLGTTCETFGVTVKSALSAASVIATCHLAKHKMTSIINTRIQMPYRINRQVQPPVNEEDCVCGTAALIYDVSLSLDTMLWDLVKSCHKGIQETITAGYAFEWLAAVNGMTMHKTGKHVQLPVVTTVCSGINANPIRVNYGKRLSVSEVKVIGALSNGIINLTHTHITTHAYMFNEELNVSVEYNVPFVQDNEAQNYGTICQDVLKYLASSDMKFQLTVGDVLKNAQQ